MSDFIQDTKDARELFTKWPDSHAIFDQDCKTIDALIQKYGDERDTCFETMLKLLEQREENLAEKWQRICDWGLDLLKDLNSAIPSTAGDGLKGIGLGNFAEGEKKILEENRKAAIATMAEIISKIGTNDNELITQLQEDLRKAKEDSLVIDSQVRALGIENKQTMHEMTTKAIAWLGEKAVSQIPLVGEKLAPYAGKVEDIADKASPKFRELGEKKKALKTIVLNNREKIDNLKSKIDDGWITNIRDEALKCADSLQGIGRNDPYKAADWKTFGEECKTRLKDRSEFSLERATYLFKTVYPAYVEGLTGAFFGLLNDNESLAKLKRELDDEIEALYQSVRQADACLSALKDGSIKNSATTTLRKIRDDVKAKLDKLKVDLEEADEISRLS